MTRPMPDLPGVEHEYVETGAVRLHVALAGAGEPLVLLHGWPEHWFAWRKLIGPLAEHYRVICPDLRGFGWSDAPPNGYEKDSLANDIASLLDALGIERARVMGHDWGAWTGFLLALHRPERVERFVMTAFPHPWSKIEAKDVPGMWRMIYQPVLATPVVGAAIMRQRTAIGRLIRSSAVRSSAWTDEELELLLSQFDEPARANAAVQLYRTFVLRELRELAGGRFDSERLTVPTLLVAGDGDPVMNSERIGGFESHADDMRAEVIAGAGHWLPEEAPDELLALVVPFLSGG